jgi:hypothetical protein
VKMLLLVFEAGVLLGTGFTGDTLWTWLGTIAYIISCLKMPLLHVNTVMNFQCNYQLLKIPVFSVNTVMNFRGDHQLPKNVFAPWSDCTTTYTSAFTLHLRLGFIDLFQLGYIFYITFETKHYPTSQNVKKFKVFWKHKSRIL